MIYTFCDKHGCTSKTDGTFGDPILYFKTEHKGWTIALSSTLEKIIHLCPKCSKEFSELERKFLIGEI